MACLLRKLQQFFMMRWHLAQEDNDSKGEKRWVLVGLSDQARLLTVVYTLRNENTIRLISARKATKKEAEYYA